jgi:C-terminal processing protease CtpA/Prc
MMNKEMARTQFLHRPTHLKYRERAAIFGSTFQKVIKNYFDPNYNGTDWPRRARENRDQILAIQDPEPFELAMHELVRSLRTSHTGFFHESVRRVPGRLAIGATFRKLETADGSHWVVQEVHEGGPAWRAGLRSLDVLIHSNGSAVTPPEQPMFPMGAQVNISVQRGSQEFALSVDIPVPRSRKQPYSEPTPVSFSKLKDRVGYLKVTILPGLLGLDVARDIDRAVAELSDCERLILDLRGHLGGGLGVLRLMSYLTANKLPIGYTITRRRAETGYRKEALRKVEHLPTNLPNFAAIVSMALKHARRDPSVAVVSEGLGPQRWHGRIVILANEHTISAGEMVCAFARENHLATIVGNETGGRLIPGSGFKVGYGYRVILPNAEYITWQGQTFEGQGVVPDVLVPWSLDAARSGVDNQLNTAIEIVSSL